MLFDCTVVAVADSIAVAVGVADSMVRVQMARKRPRIVTDFEEEPSTSADVHGALSPLKKGLERSTMENGVCISEI